MIQFDRTPIQVELGDKGRESYDLNKNQNSYKKKTEKGKPTGIDYYVDITDQVRESLRVEGIEMPEVTIVSDSDLPPETIRIHFGIGFDDYNVTKDDYREVLEKKVRYYHSIEPTKENASRLLNEALELISNKKLHDAMDVLMRTYYLSTLAEQQTVRIAALLNISGICLINKKPNEAYSVAVYAQILSEKPDFYDPYFKFYSHRAMAYIAAAHGEYTDSATFFNKAYQDIEMLNECKYKVDTLCNEALALMKANEYKKCIQTIDRMYSYVKDDDSFGKDVINELYEIRACISDAVIEKLEIRVYKLQEKCRNLSESLTIRIWGVAEGFICKYGLQIVFASLGSLMGGDKYIQTTEKGTNIAGKIIEVNT